MLKKIRIEYYRYRIRKGRVDVLLQKTDGSASFCIPFRYAEEGDSVSGLVRNGEVTDDGDLVIRLVDDHFSSKGYEWIPLGELKGYQLERNDHLESLKTIFRLFLRSRDKVSGSADMPDPSLMEKVEGWYDAILMERARLGYIEALREALNGKGPVVFDAVPVPPSKEVIEREIETLEHFNPRRNGDEYDWYIDWKALGWRFKSILFFHDKGILASWMDSLK